VQDDHPLVEYGWPDAYDPYQWAAAHVAAYPYTLNLTELYPG
jgi:hypothetical protein